MWVRSKPSDSSAPGSPITMTTVSAAAATSIGLGEQSLVVAGVADPVAGGEGDLAVDRASSSSSSVSTRVGLTCERPGALEPRGAGELADHRDRSRRRPAAGRAVVLQQHHRLGGGLPGQRVVGVRRRTTRRARARACPWRPAPAPSGPGRRGPRSAPPRTATAATTCLGAAPQRRAASPGRARRAAPVPGGRPRPSRRRPAPRSPNSSRSTVVEQPGVLRRGQRR